MARRVLLRVTQITGSKVCVSLKHFSTLSHTPSLKYSQNTFPRPSTGTYCWLSAYFFLAPGNLQLSETKTRHAGESLSGSTSIDKSGHDSQVVDTSTNLSELRSKLPTTGRISLAPPLKLNLDGLRLSELDHEVYNNTAPDVQNTYTAPSGPPKNNVVGEHSGDGRDEVRKAIYKLRVPHTRGRNPDEEPRGYEEGAEPARNSARQGEDSTGINSTESASVLAEGLDRIWNDEDLEALAQLGEGAGGEVHKVKDRKTGKLMARKVSVIISSKKPSHTQG